MNYSEMSDFEINKLVAEALGLTPLQPESDAIEKVYLQGFASVYFRDYCNTPSDAFPIIFENKITTYWAFDDMWKAEINNQGVTGPFVKFDMVDKNPLRAAMIVYLYLKEGQ